MRPGLLSPGMVRPVRQGEAGRGGAGPGVGVLAKQPPLSDRTTLRHYITVLPNTVGLHPLSSESCLTDGMP